MGAGPQAERPAGFRPRADTDAESIKAGSARPYTVCPPLPRARAQRGGFPPHIRKPSPKGRNSRAARPPSDTRPARPARPQAPGSAPWAFPRRPAHGYRRGSLQECAAAGPTPGSGRRGPPPAGAPAWRHQPRPAAQARTKAAAPKRPDMPPTAVLQAGKKRPILREGPALVSLNHTVLTNFFPFLLTETAHAGKPLFTLHGSLAQLVEQLTLNQLVRGSSP